MDKTKSVVRKRSGFHKEMSEMFVEIHNMLDEILQEVKALRNEMRDFNRREQERSEDHDKRLTTLESS